MTNYNPLDEALKELKAIRSYWESRQLFNNPPLTKGDDYRLRHARVKIAEIESHLEAEGVANAEYYDTLQEVDDLMSGTGAYHTTGCDDTVKKALDKVAKLIEESDTPAVFKNAVTDHLKGGA